MIKVLIVDDHTMIADSFALLLNNSSEDINVIDIASNGEQALKKNVQLLPDVLLLDVILPDMSGLDVCEKILHQNPKTKIIGFTGARNSNASLKFQRLGALGFVHKEETIQILIEAITSVAQGKPYFLQITEETSPFEKLSPTETSIIRYFLQGFKQKDIAEKLNVKYKTVGTHRHRAFKKLRVKNDVELSKLADKFDFK